MAESTVYIGCLVPISTSRKLDDVARRRKTSKKFLLRKMVAEFLEESEPIPEERRPGRPKK